MMAWLRQLICVHGPFEEREPRFAIGIDKHCARCGKLILRIRPG